MYRDMILNSFAFRRFEEIRKLGLFQPISNFLLKRTQTGEWLLNGSTTPFDSV